MIESLNGTYEIHEDGSVSGYYFDGNPFVWSAAMLASSHHKDADTFANFLNAWCYKRRAPGTKPEQFRIGGVYHNGKGDVVRLKPSDVYSEWPVLSQFVEYGRNPGGASFHRLSDGASNSSLRQYDLIPGELIERDGEWVSADSTITFPSGAQLQTSGGYITGRIEPQIVSIEVQAECAANARMVARDDRAPTSRERQAMTRIHLIAAFKQAVCDARNKPKLPLPANANLLRG